MNRHHFSPLQQFRAAQGAEGDRVFGLVPRHGGMTDQALHMLQRRALADPDPAVKRFTALAQCWEAVLPTSLDTIEIELPTNLAREVAGGDAAVRPR